MKKGKTPFRPLNPHHPTPTGDSWAGGAEKQIPVSNRVLSDAEIAALNNSANETPAIDPKTRTDAKTVAETQHAQYSVGKDGKAPAKN
jgi:hypothetical protein